MPNFRVIYSKAAINEVCGIQRYIAHELDNAEAASKQVNRIMSASESLSVFPKMHRVRFKDSEGRKIRVFPVDNYLVLYSLNEDRNIIDILHVIYGRRNIDSLI